MDMFEDRRPEIDYPCAWGYRIIGTSEAEIRALLVEIVGDAEHAIEPSNTSRDGTYVSLHLTVHVADEEHRRSVHGRIREAACVKMVL